MSDALKLRAAASDIVDGLRQELERVKSWLVGRLVGASKLQGIVSLDLRPRKMDAVAGGGADHE